MNGWLPSCPVVDYPCSLPENRIRALVPMSGPLTSADTFSMPACLARVELEPVPQKVRFVTRGDGIVHTYLYGASLNEGGRGVWSLHRSVGAWSIGGRRKSGEQVRCGGVYACGMRRNVGVCQCLVDYGVVGLAGEISGLERVVCVGLSRKA